MTMAAVAAATLCGCAATDRITAGYLDARQAAGLDPAPVRTATQVSLVMQRRLATLPDPTREDAEQGGLPGQVFLMAADGKPVAAAGNLTVTVTDATPRPPGQPPRTTEKWQFTPDVLHRLTVRDDRFGECYALFLPWPEDWADVTRVAVKAVYQAPGSIELHAPEVGVVLEQNTAGGETWKKTEPFRMPPAGEPKPAGPPPAPFLLPPPIQVPPAATGPPAVGPQTIVLPRGG